MYGLAGLRIGYGFAHADLIRNLLKVKLPFEPGTLSQAAGIAALEDADFLLRTVENNREGRAFNGEAFNVGGDEHITHRDLVALLVRLAGSGRYRFVDWPAEKKAIDIGSFHADSSLFKSRTGWAPMVRLEEGFARTFEYYRAHFDRYVDAADAAGGQR